MPHADVDGLRINYEVQGDGEPLLLVPYLAAERLTGPIAGSELTMFDHLSHAGLHEDAEAFNRASLDFLLRHRE